MYPKNVHHTQETLFDKLDTFENEYTDEQKLFKNLAFLDFESVCVQEARFKSTDTTKRIRKKNLTLVAISPNLVKACYFFIGAFEILAVQSKAILESLFFDIETTIQKNLGSILKKLTQRRNRREQAAMDDCDNKTCTSTWFEQIQKKQLIDLQGLLKHFFNVLSVFGFNSTNYDLNQIKFYLLPVLGNKRKIEPTVIKKANQFI